MNIRVKKSVAERESRSTASVLRSIKTLINDGDGVGGGVGGGGADGAAREEAEEDASSLLLVGDGSEWFDTSSTRTIVFLLWQKRRDVYPDLANVNRSTERIITSNRSGRVNANELMLLAPMKDWHSGERLHWSKREEIFPDHFHLNGINAEQIGWDWSPSDSLFPIGGISVSRAALLYFPEARRWLAQRWSSRSHSWRRCSNAIPSVE